MVGTNLKAETMALMNKREDLETEMNVIIQSLCQPGAPGLSGNLVDSEGFPREDIDIHTIRIDRNRLAQLKNDYKDLTEKIDRNIQLLHATKLAPKLSTPLDSENRQETINQVPTSTASMDIDVALAVDTSLIVKVPFAMVDEIAEGSPAAEDGLQLGDQIVKFGSVESGDNLLSRLSSEVQAHENSVLSVVALRQGAVTSLSVTPRTWHGRGLLGCHFRIL